MDMIILWLVLFLIFIVAEIATAGALVSIWFCVGALVSMGVAYLGGGILLQVILFVVVSIGLLLGTRPFIKKYIKPQISATNADRILNKRGIVEEEINNLKGQGAVLVDGKSWTARNSSGEIIIPKGEEVRIVRIEGVKAMVETIEKKQ